MPKMNEILPPAPVKYPVTNASDGTFHPIWQRFFTNLNGVIGQFFPPVLRQTASGVRHVALSQAANLTTSERDQLVNIPAGTVIYNSTTEKFNFREGNAWRELP